MVSLLLLAGCVAQNPRVELPANTPPPIVLRQRALSEDAADKLLQTALQRYKDGAGIRELVDSVRRYSSAPLTAPDVSVSTTRTK